MRKNVKQQLALRVLSTAALMAMVSSIATAAFADTYDLNKGSVTVKTKDDGITYVTQENTEINDHQDDTGVTITSNGEKTSNTITVETAKDQTTDVTLENVDIEQPDSHGIGNTDPAPIEIKGNGSTNLELNGDNTVLSGNRNHAGIEKADVNGTGTLTIKDDLNDKGEEKTGTDKDSTLLAGGYYGGAGIGGGKDGTGKNIRIEGNADVAAFGGGGAAIGSGYESSSGNSDITITDHATVVAASQNGCGIGQGLNAHGKATITISGDASVHAEAFGSQAAIGSGPTSTTVNIEDHADVTAVGRGVVIGTGYGHEGTSTVINITGGTVNAVTRDDHSKPAIGTVNGSLDLTINSSTGKTTVNAYTTGNDPLSLNIGNADQYDSSTGKYRTSPSEGAEYNKDGSSNLGEDNAAIINSYCNTTLGTDTFKAPKTLDTYAFPDSSDYPKHTLSDKDKGDLTKVVHNRKYMEENPNIDITKLKDEDLHDWQPDPDGKYKEPTLEEDGYVDCICSIDKCGQTKRVPLPKLTPKPSEPDTPSTPETPDTPDTPSTPDVPSTPEVTPADPAVTPDAHAPVQDSTAPADTLAADTTADAAVVPADAQNLVQDAKPEATAASTAAVAALPQTGANWLAVVGSALSGMFLLAAGFVLDRKNRRMN